VKTGKRPRLLVLAVGLGVGGAEELIRESLPLAEAEGFDVTVWSLLRGGTVLDEIRRSGGKVELLGAPALWPAAWVHRLWKGLRRERFDLIHSHLFGANLAARLAGHAAGVPVILNSHHGTDAWIGAWPRLLERTTSSLVDRIITCSEAVRRYALEELGLPAERLVVVPNGIRFQRFVLPGRRDSVRAALGLAPDQLVVGTVGRLDEPKKGMAILVDALERVAARIPNVVCLVVGDGTGRRLLEEKVRRKNLEPHVRFLGERRDIPELLQALDLYVQPSLWEGFGLSALEAMASGLPVIASRVGGLPEVVEEGKTGDLVPPGDAQLLADRMTALLCAGERRDRYGREGRRRAQDHFPLDKMVRGWTDLYRELLSEKRCEEAA